MSLSTTGISILQALIALIDLLVGTSTSLQSMLATKDRNRAETEFFNDQAIVLVVISNHILEQATTARSQDLQMALVVVVFLISL